MVLDELVTAILSVKFVCVDIDQELAAGLCLW